MEYHVAFSLLSDDQVHAEAIQKALPKDISTFLYSMRQRELILARDGRNAFPEVFRNASLCVILYRQKWGTTPWTPLEERTLGNRFMDEGSGFLILLSLDTSSAIPSWFPRAALWVDFLSEGPESTAGYIGDRLGSHSSDFRTRQTSRSFGRRPVPIAKYQRQVQRITKQFKAVRPKICDACTSMIEFRPLVEVTLLAREGFPACTEQLCPRCARERGIQISIPAEMSEEMVFAKSNPRYYRHIDRLLRRPVLGSLTADSDLHEQGVTNVGAIGGRTSVELHVSLSDELNRKLPFDLFELENNDLKSANELISYFKKAILSELRGAV